MYENYITTHPASSSSLLPTSLLRFSVATSTSDLRPGLGVTLLVLVTSGVTASLSRVSRPGSSCSPPPPRSLMLQASAGSCMAGDVALSTWLGFRGRGGRYVAGHGGETGARGQRRSTGCTEDTCRPASGGRGRAWRWSHRGRTWRC